MLHFLTVPARVVYRAKDFQSGFVDVHAIVLRPDGRQQFLQLNELPAPFQGIYVNYLITNPDDPLGDYLVQVNAPSDGIKDVTRFTFGPIPASQPSVDALALKVQNMIDILEIFTL